MQFGIGLLGKGWSRELAVEIALGNDLPAHPNFGRAAEKYAAKLAADTVLAQPPTRPDLTDDGLVRHFAACARSVRRSEVEQVRCAFLALYPHRARRSVPESEGQ